MEESDNDITQPFVGLGFVYIHMNRLSTQLFHCVGGHRAPAQSPPTADRSAGLHCTSKECARLKHALTRPLESAHIALHTWAKCQKLAINLIQKIRETDWFYSCLQQFDKFLIRGVSMTGNGNNVNLLKLAWKNSWNHVKHGLWNFCTETLLYMVSPYSHHYYVITLTTYFRHS